MTINPIPAHLIKPFINDELTKRLREEVERRRKLAEKENATEEPEPEKGSGE